MASGSVEGRLTPLVEGYVYRGGDVVNQMINQRYMQIFDDCIMQHKTKEQMAESGKSPKIFHLDGTCTVSIVYAEDMLLKAKGKSTVQALVMSSYEKKHLQVFTIRWILSHSHYLSSDHLTLGFDEESEANRWRDAIQRSIDKLPAKKLPRDGGDKATESDRRPSMSGERSPQGAINQQDGSQDPSAPSQQEEASPKLKHIKSDSSSQLSLRRQDSVNTTGGVNQEWIQRASFPTKWVSQSFYNGIAVYREQDKDGGAYMCHTVIRSSPKEVFNAVQRFEVGFNSTLQNMTILETFQADNTQIVHCDISAQGLLVPFFGARDIVAQRSWRVEDDGTHVVIMNSVEHPLCPPPKQKKGLAWFTSPVRAQVIAAGFTIAPLKPKHLPEDLDSKDSPESLLTVVMRVDVGGAANWFGSASRWLENMWMWPMVSSIAGVRERMEQRRFVGSLLLEENEQQSLTAPPPGDGNDGGKPAESYSLGPLQSVIQNSELPEGVTGAKDWVMDTKYWNCPGIADYKVRGKNYLSDRKKVTSAEPAFELDSLFLLKLDGMTEHMAQYLVPPSAKGFHFVVNIMVPGNDHLVIVWRDLPKSTEEDDDDAHKTPFTTSLARFLFGDGPTFDQQRHSTFKLIPHVAEGSWVIKQSVGATPVLLGNKLRQTYHRGTNYFEVDIDIASSRAARSVVGMVAGATKTVVVDMGILMEGHKEDELPERLLGTVQLNRIDMEEGSRVTQKELDALRLSYRKNQ